jgi:hypothetical protein
MEWWASSRIVEAVAEYEKEDQSNLPPLSDSINSGTLNTAFAETDVGSSLAGCSTFFDYGYAVLVQSTSLILTKKK